MNTQEITNRVYDTLMGNGNISPAHITIDPNEVAGQEVDAAKHLITFEYEGQRVTLHVTSEQLNESTFCNNCQKETPTDSEGTCSVCKHDN